MKRDEFLKLVSIAAAGIQLGFNSKSLILNLDNKAIQQALGLDDSHLVSEFIKLEKNTYQAFSQMKSKAAEAGIDINIVSGYRSFEHQKEIWERKFKHLTSEKKPLQAIMEIIKYSSIPGTSRHHWGTDIDIIDSAAQAPSGDLLIEKHYHNNGTFSKLKSWMDLNSKDFGFELVYTNDKERTGFKYEPWHYSFKPESKKYLKIQSQDNFLKAWQNLEFEGKSYLTDEFITTYFETYNLGINPVLMQF